VPDDDLTWLWGSIELREPLRTAVQREIDRRFPLAAKKPADEVRQVAGEVVAAGFRVLARKRHPDHGGAHQAILALNAAHEWLRAKWQREVDSTRLLTPLPALR
jgi:hypothetical protein